jgi:hypothetical protein
VVVYEGGRVLAEVPARGGHAFSLSSALGAIEQTPFCPSDCVNADVRRRKSIQLSDSIPAQSPFEPVPVAGRTLWISRMQANAVELAGVLR